MSPSFCNREKVDRMLLIPFSSWLRFSCTCHWPGYATLFIRIFGNAYPIKDKRSHIFFTVCVILMLWVSWANILARRETCTSPCTNMLVLPALSRLRRFDKQVYRYSKESWGLPLSMHDFWSRRHIKPPRKNTTQQPWPVVSLTVKLFEIYLQMTSHFLCNGGQFEQREGAVSICL